MTPTPTPTPKGTPIEELYKAGKCLYIAVDQEIADDVMAQIDAVVSITQEKENRLEQLNLVLEGYKVLAGLSDPDPLKIQRMIIAQLADQQKKLEECKCQN